MIVLKKQLQIKKLIFHSQRILFCVSLFFLTLFFIPFTAVAEQEDPQITVIFRMDDYSSRSATYIERKIINLFAECNVPITFGVIPFMTAGFVQDTSAQEVIPLAPDKANILGQAIKAGIVDAALHGYSHQNTRDRSQGKSTEFAGLDYNSQLLKIREGKNFLEKILAVPVVTFIPPWSTYDDNTLRSLEKLNFQCLSANLTGYASSVSSLKFLPATCNLHELRGVIELARKITDTQPIICVLFHEYDFREINYEVDNKEDQISFGEFVELVRWVARQKDLKVKSIGQVIKENIDLGVDRFINNKYYLRLAHLKPSFWPPHYGVYVARETAYNVRIRNLFVDINIPRLKNILAVASFYVIIMVVFIVMAFLSGLIIFRLLSVSQLSYTIIKYLSIIFGFILSGYLLFIHKIEYKQLILIVSLTGICIGLWLSSFKKKRYFHKI
jgi:hypothetical protein